MASAFAELLNDSPQKFLLNVKFFLQKTKYFSRSMQQRIAVAYCENPQAEKDDIINTAATELIRQLLEHADEVDLLLSYLQREEQAGELSPNDVWERLLEKGFSYLRTSLKDTERRQSPGKHLYKRLRECLNKSGKFAWSCDGRSYGPSDLPPESPVAPNDDAGFADLPEPESIATEKVITQKYLVPQALRFWHSYIERRLNGIPHFQPVYNLQNWLCRKYMLAPLSQQEGLYIEDEDGSSDLRALPQLTNTRAPDTQLEEEEMLERAKDFVLSLPDRLAAFCTLYYGDEERQEDVARALGYSSASGLARIKKDFESRLRDCMAEYAELLEQSPAGKQTAQNFLDAVYAACKKRYVASNKETGGLHHE